MTIVEPTGVPAIIEMSIPRVVQTTDMQAEHTVTARKLLNTRIAESVGKIIRAEIKSEPTRFIASTMVTAVMVAISRL